MMAEHDGRTREHILTVHHEFFTKPAEHVQQLLHDAIMMEDLEDDPDIFSDGTVYKDLDHGNDRC